MTKIKKYYIVGIVLLILLSVFSVFKLEQIKSIPQPKKSAGFPVETVIASNKNLSQGLSYIGTIESYEDVKLAAKISSRIIDISGEEGSTIKSGDLLITLDNEDINGKISTMEIKVKEAKINLDYWNSQAEIYEALFDEGVISQQEFRKIIFNRDTAANAYKQAKSSLQEAKISLENSTIYSPISGTIIHIYSNMGDMTTPGKEIINVADTNRLKVNVKVVEGDLAKIKEGIPVNLSVNDQSIIFKSQVTDILPSVDKNARTCSVEISIPQEMMQNQNIKLGMSINVFFVLEENQNALAVPINTVITDGNETYLYTVVDNSAKKQVVTTGISNDQYIQITSGLKQGDSVIFTGLTEIYDGREVYLAGGLK